jgi:hypothetical protein
LLISGSERVRPALPPVQYTQHLHEVSADPVRHKVGRLADDEFPRSDAPTWTPAVWEAGKTGYGSED